MYYPDFEEFKRLAKKGNLIPVYREILADMETPVSSFLKISESTPEYGYLLESVEGGERLGRYSFISGPPFLIFESKGERVRLKMGDNAWEEKSSRDPFGELKKCLRRFYPVNLPGLPRFYSGAVGYVGYETVRFFEKLPDLKGPDPLGLPDMVFLFTDQILIFDHISHTIKIVSCAHINGKDDLKKIYEGSCGNIERIIKKLKGTYRKAAARPRHAEGDGIKSNFTREDFKKAVKKAKEYIVAGDVIQVVLSRNISAGFHSDPFDAYRCLRVINPSPYMYYLKLGNFQIAGSSPEILVRDEDGSIETRPIAGTRPRGKDEKADLILEKELLKDPKELAEHVMLVDLGRNDIGRVSEYGTVGIPQFMIVEKYSHVMHIVSSVCGKLKKGCDSFDVFRACFPAGTVTGAPKIRAMEIIGELEKTTRGPYAGAIGYFGFQGNMDMAITIRTIIFKDGKACLQAGAGIVADSDPDREYEETSNKAEAMLKALEMAGKGIE